MKRFDVTWFGKAGTFALMFAFPRSCSRPATRCSRMRLGWIALGDRASRASCSATTRRRTYVPEARRALREGRHRTGGSALVKAVIMAGGEGTRLRPLTSNAPKPMLPRRQPADDGAHRRPAAQARLRRDRRHGRVHGQRDPDLLRRRLRVRRADDLRHRGRRRSAPPARSRNADGAARRALPRDLRRRAHRHRPQRDRRRSTTSTRRWPRSGSSHVENPLEFGIVITREDGSIERFLEKPTWGQVFSDTINTGIYVLEPEIFDYIDRGRAGRLLERGVPARCSPTASRSFGAIAEGYWEDVGTLEAYLRAHKDVLDGRVARRHPGLRDRATACGSARAPRSIPDAAGRRARGDRRRLPRRGRRAARRVHRARRQRPGARRRRPRARRRPRQRLPRRGRAPARRGRRPVVRPPRGVRAARRAWCSATSASSARTPCSPRA